MWVAEERSTLYVIVSENSSESAANRVQNRERKEIRIKAKQQIKKFETEKERKKREKQKQILNLKKNKRIYRFLYESCFM